jgi:dUTP pyrophosphatase
LAVKYGLSLPNTPGTIDADYRGEVKIAMINLGAEPVTIRRGERIAQLVVAPVVRAALEVVSELDDTTRGSGGFGHTGV